MTDLSAKPLPPEKVDQIRDVMFKYAQEARGSEYRTEEQTRQIAENDANVMLAVAPLNEDQATSPGVLGGRAYIVTASGRYIRAAQRCNIHERISARPQILMGLLEMIGPPVLTDHQFVDLFENPLLQQVADSCWSQITTLWEAGFDLHDKSLTRLRHDTEAKLHGRTSAMAEAEDETSEEAHRALVEAAHPLGYRLIQPMEQLLRKTKAKESELQRLLVENAELREVVTEFGRKKARWLRRFDRKKGLSSP